MTAPDERVEVRVSGAADRPTLVYLPGLHGDWTLIAGLRGALRGRVRLVELTYPRTLAWSLDHYAQGVAAALRREGIAGGWLLGESFGSQVLWPLAANPGFHVEGIILAGGFTRHPMPWGARLVAGMLRACPLPCLRLGLRAYGAVARCRFGSAPEVAAGTREFIARRTREDLQAILHRLRLVAENQPAALLREVRVPVYALTGWLDPIVPWFFVRPALRRDCRTLRAYRILNGDHNVLNSAPTQAARQIIEWVGGDARP